MNDPGSQEEEEEEQGKKGGENAGTRRAVCFGYNLKLNG